MTKAEFEQKYKGCIAKNLFISRKDSTIIGVIVGFYDRAPFEDNDLLIMGITHSEDYKGFKLSDGIHPNVKIEAKEATYPKGFITMFAHEVINPRK